MRPVLLLASVALMAATPPPRWVTPTDVIAAAPASAWKTISAEDLLVFDFKSGARVVVQLAPMFAPAHVANIRALSRVRWWDGAAVYRVQDNYVVQWGQNDARRLPDAIEARPPPEVDRPAAGLRVTPFPYRDSFAARAGHVAGWPVALRGTHVNLTHCYGTVGVGRDLSPDTGTGGELYAVIGHGPRALDQNIAVVGRVVAGIESLSSLPRGSEALGFYKERSSDVPILSARLASDLPATNRPAFEVMDTSSRSFATYVRARANRHDDFFVQPAGGVDLCGAPVPIRPVKR